MGGKMSRVGRDRGSDGPSPEKALRFVGFLRGKMATDTGAIACGGANCALVTDLTIISGSFNR